MGLFNLDVGCWPLYLVDRPQVCQGIDRAILGLSTMRPHICRQAYSGKFAESCTAMEMVLMNKKKRPAVVGGSFFIKNTCNHKKVMSEYPTQCERSSVG